MRLVSYNYYLGKLNNVTIVFLKIFKEVVIPVLSTSPCFKFLGVLLPAFYSLTQVWVKLLNRLCRFKIPPGRR